MMIKIFTSLIFFAEIILFFNIIFLINKANKKVCELDKLVIKGKSKIIFVLWDLKFELSEFQTRLRKITVFIDKKKQEYKFKTIKRIIFYICLVFLRGKYRKLVLTGKLIRDIYKGFNIGINLT